MLRPVALLATCALLTSAASGQLLTERLTGAPFAQFGSAISAVGDLDGDGVDDFAVGEPVYNLSSASGEGRLSLFSGKDSSLIQVFVGAEHDGLGSSVAAAGDVDGDGVPDIVAGAPTHMSDEFFEEGLAVVYSGLTGGVLWTVHGNNDFEWVGTSVSGAGDFNGDGHPEVLVGTSFDYMLAVEHDGSTLWKISGGLLFGHRVQGIGDVGGDGVDDFLVSESWYDASPTQPRRGRVHVYSGATGEQLYVVVGDEDNDYLGRTLARLGDVDGDAIPDFIAASYVSSQGGNQSGIVRVLSGADGSTLKNLVGEGDSKWFGFAVTGCTDLDLDGVPDYAVGIPGVPTTGSNGLGQVQLYSGADGSLLHDVFGQREGAASNVALGMAVASADFNLDGAPDFVLGDPVFNNPTLGGPVGAAEVYLGCPAASMDYGSGWPGTTGVPMLTAFGEPGLGATLTLKIDNSLGATTPGLLFIGLESTSITLPSGATLLVDPALTLPITVLSGGTVIAGTIPDDVSLCFTTLSLQAIELDPGAVGNRSFTAGLELALGFGF